jgi:hypothetical protein
MIAAHRHAITNLKLETTTGFYNVIHLYVSRLDAHLGLSTGRDPALPLQELIEPHGRRIARKSIDSLTRC